MALQKLGTDCTLREAKPAQIPPPSSLPIRSHLRGRSESVFLGKKLSARAVCMTALAFDARCSFLLLALKLHICLRPQQKLLRRARQSMDRIQAPLLVRVDTRSVARSHMCRLSVYSGSCRAPPDSLETGYSGDRSAHTDPNVVGQETAGDRPVEQSFRISFVHNRCAGRRFLRRDAPMRRQRQVARLDPAVVLEALLLRRQPLQVGLLPLQFLRSGRAAPDALASRADDAGPLERQELERAPDVEDLAAGRVAS